MEKRYNNGCIKLEENALKLSQLLQFDNIIIQCHNNPDADALASGFAVFKYLKTNGKNVKFVYGGNLKYPKVI